MDVTGTTRRALSEVDWRDLRAMSAWERFCAVSLASPLLVASLFAASRGELLVAFGFAFFFFTAGLRQAHDGFHVNLGLRTGANDVFLAFQSLLMLAPLHAIQFCHLEHHRAPLSRDDVEGWSARLRGWQAVATGPWFTARLIARALTRAEGELRRWVVLESIAISIYVAVAARWGGPVLHFHVLAMLLGNCLTGFFAVWVVHHDCEDEGIFARTQRSKWLDAVTFKLLYHFEHHVFPAVPSCHLPELGRRIDAVLPRLREFEVVPIARHRAKRTKTSPPSDRRRDLRHPLGNVRSRHEPNVSRSPGVIAS